MRATGRICHHIETITFPTFVVLVPDLALEYPTVLSQFYG